MGIDIKVQENREHSLEDFLNDRDYFVESVSDNVLKVSNAEGIDVYVHFDKKTLFFEMDVGEVDGIESKELYAKLLELNTEILPVSIGLDTTAGKPGRLVLVESREAINLDDNELLSVF